MKNNYLKNIDETAFHAWLRANGWTEDTSPSTESWPVPAWWHEGRMVTKREDYLADDYENYLYELRRDPFASDNPNNAPHLDR